MRPDREVKSLPGTISGSEININKLPADTGASYKGYKIDINALRAKASAHKMINTLPADTGTNSKIDDFRMDRDIDTLPYDDGDTSSLMPTVPKKRKKKGISGINGKPMCSDTEIECSDTEIDSDASLDDTVTIKTPPSKKLRIGRLVESVD